MASATDNFNRTNDNTGLGGNWTQIGDGGIWIVHSNGAWSNLDGLWELAAYTGTVFTGDHESSFTIGTQGSSTLGPAVRMQGTGATRSCYYYDTIAGTIEKVINGTRTTLQSSLATCTAGDVAKCQIVGSTIKAFKNGVQTGSDQASGGELTGGSPGMLTQGAGAQSDVDDWAGADVSSGVTAAQELPAFLQASLEPYGVQNT